MYVIVSTLVHGCEGEVFLYIGVMWYNSVEHPPAVIAFFCCHSLFALGSFDAFLIPVVTMEMQGFFFVTCIVKGRCMAEIQGDSS